MSARNPIKCPICAKSNRVSGLRKLSREDLAKLRARRSGEISRAKSRARNRACEIARAKSRVRNRACEIARAKSRGANRTLH
eukprot:COSAG06_NODE_3709_length_4992_cov_69.619661_1_plen_82_part_00